MSKNLQRALLVVFVLVDIVLVTVAVRHVNSSPPSSDLPETVTASPTPSAAPGPPTESTAAPAQLDYTFTASEAVALSASNDGTIAFGTRGRCVSGAEAVLTVSTNGGEDFSEQKTGLTTTLAVKATASSIAVVGTDDECRARQLTSTDGGATWEESDEIELWYPDAQDTTTVVSPEGASVPDASCVVTSVSQVTAASARVSCADGAFWGSGDNGKTWVQLGRLDNARVAAFLTPSSGVALARYNGCAANQFATSDGGVTWEAGGCITGDPAQAIAVTSNGLTAVVAGEAYVSEDDGQTWSQP